MGKAIHKLMRGVARATGWRQLTQRMRYRGLAIGDTYPKARFNGDLMAPEREAVTRYPKLYSAFC